MKFEVLSQEEPRRSGRRYKQTQFGPTRLMAGTEHAKQTQFQGVRMAGRIPIITLFYRYSVPVRRLSCETKPISGASELSVTAVQE